MELIESADRLRSRWQQRSDITDVVWPTESWNELRAERVTGWTIVAEFGGAELSAESLIAGGLELARGDLLVTFVLSQFQAACQRLAIAASSELRQRWLPRLAVGEVFATVGISHLTTSRQHTSPAVTATATADGYRLKGEVPWVTGAGRADVIVAGGALEDGRQILTAIPTNRPGVVIGSPLPLLALTGSETGPITLTDVEVRGEEVIAGPVTGVVQQASTGGAGSLMTSTLATGHAFACLDHLEVEASRRAALEPVLRSLSSEAHDLRRDLLTAAGRRTENAETPEQLRARATDLALRASQALLTATKGAGFVVGHPAERLARQALFFLVWSCPQSVANQLLLNFGGCEGY